RDDQIPWGRRVQNRERRILERMPQTRDALGEKMAVMRDDRAAVHDRPAYAWPLYQRPDAVRDIVDDLFVGSTGRIDSPAVGREQASIGRMKDEIVMDGN